jgi:glycosyltransferase involved in cell wall biosynthesis
MPEPSISVLVPSLNAAEFIADALHSALAQSPAPLEVLVQDGGSDDGTVAAVEAIGDRRVSVTSEPDAGQSDAFNRALGRARGEWIAWLNADDLLAPDAFAVAAPLARGDVDMVYGDFAWVDDRGEVVKPVPVPELDRERLLKQGNYLFSGAALFRRSVFERFGGLDPELRIAMDYDLYLRICPEIHAVHCGATLAYFRQHGGSTTSEISWALVRETNRVRRRHGGYSRRTAAPILWNNLQQVVDVSSMPLRRALRRTGG